MNYFLGIESTAHTFGVAVLDLKGEIISNVKRTYTTKSGGMIPLDVKKHHEEIANEVFIESLTKAGIKEDDICAIAFSNAPGLAPCLLVGMNFAKDLSKRLKVGLIGVNHCIAHLEIGEITGAKDSVLLYVSGANTQVIAYEFGKYRIFGETLDLGVGNFIDTFARFIGLGFPGGPKVEELAKKSSNLIELPYSIKGMDISLSGIQTKLRRLYSEGENINDLAFSMQETVFAMLVEAAERALAHTGKKELLLGGGVACNKRLQEMCEVMCKERGAKFFCPDNQFLVDNAAMIGYLGLKMYRVGILERDLSKIDIFPRERTDDVKVIWKKM